MSHDLRLERVYDAAPEVVFDAFTDPEAQKELYADAPDWVVEAECDLRVGDDGASRSARRDTRRPGRPTCSGWSIGRGGWSTPRR